MTRISSLFEKQGQTISCVEGGISFIFSCGGLEFKKAKFDTDTNPLLQNENLRCDYVIVSNDFKNIAIYVELKGNDIKKAYNQITSTKQLVGSNIAKNYGAIVYKSSSPNARTNIQNIKASSKKEFTKLFITSKHMQLSYHDCCIKKHN